MWRCRKSPKMTLLFLQTLDFFYRFKRCVYLCVLHAFRNMTLVLVLKVPEGLVLAAESRVTVKADDKFGKKYIGNYDTATKLLSFKTQKYIGALVYGDEPIIGKKAVSQYIPEFESKPELQLKRLSVEDFAKKLQDFFAEKREKKAHAQQKEKGDINFLVAGFNEGEEYGRVYWVGIPSKPNVEPMSLMTNVCTYFPAGQLEIVQRLLKGYDPKLLDILASKFNFNEQVINVLQAELGKLEQQLMIPFGLLSLQDSVKLAEFLIKTTINVQRFAVSTRGCGGAIDICTITVWEGLRHIQRKDIIS